MSVEQEKEKWLQQNTFACKLGRISPEQCKRNRERLKPHESAYGNYIASACECCREWEHLCDGFIQHRLGKGAQAVMSNGVEQQAQGDPDLCICECGTQFEPYKYGAATVRKICRPCLLAKTCRKNAPHDAVKRTAAAGDSAPKDSGPKASESSKSKPLLTITIPFDGTDKELFSRIEGIARTERRTIEAQILHWLEKNVSETASIKQETE